MTERNDGAVGDSWEERMHWRAVQRGEATDHAIRWREFLANARPMEIIHIHMGTNATVIYADDVYGHLAGNHDWR